MRLPPLTAEDEGKLRAACLPWFQAHQARHIGAGSNGGGLRARGRGRHPAVERSADLRVAAAWRAALGRQSKPIAKQWSWAGRQAVHDASPAKNKRLCLQGCFAGQPGRT